jgi:hypothetical protein
MTSVRVTIAAFVDEGFPGWVECWLVDVDGHIWKFHEKVPIVTAKQLWTDSEYPQPGWIACTVLQSKPDPSGRLVLTIDTNSPWAVESVEGTTVFEVFAEQLEGSTDKTDL